LWQFLTSAIFIRIYEKIGNELTFLKKILSLRDTSLHFLFIVSHYHLALLPLTQFADLQIFSSQHPRDSIVRALPFLRWQSMDDFYCGKFIMLTILVNRNPNFKERTYILISEV
jgi:hypothetical protein